MRKLTLKIIQTSILIRATSQIILKHKKATLSKLVQNKKMDSHILSSNKLIFKFDGEVYE